MAEAMTRHLSRELHLPRGKGRAAVRAGLGVLAPFRSRYHIGEICGGTLLLGELGVLAVAPPVGVLLLGSTLGLGGVVVRGLHRLEAAATGQRREAALAEPEGMFVDLESGLPSRQNLIEQLSREIARAQRYSHDMSIITVGVAQFEGLRACWGEETAGLAAMHVARTLARVTRASDFLARIDPSHFAVVLMQCNAEQAAIFGERVSLAVSNRPLTSGSKVRVPLYVSVETNPLQYHPAKYRGPLDFLSAAGGEVMPPVQERRKPAAAGGGRVLPLVSTRLPLADGTGTSAGTGIRVPQPAERSAIASDPRALRRQLMRDYYPEGKAVDFAEAYRAQRSGARKAV